MKPVPSPRRGVIRLFRFVGIDVFLHWSWFLVAVSEILSRSGKYSSITWNVLEYLSLFAIVLLHEFGHALACRQVGGTANQIMLWPLGGVAYVNPPPRPGATLWCIGAGPLVNLVLLPALFLIRGLSQSMGWAEAAPDLFAFLNAIWFMNLFLLIFNMLPVYPLDGGQILRSLLWFGLGRARSLMVASIIGLLGAAGFISFAIWAFNVDMGTIAIQGWLGVVCVFIFMNCWVGLRQARALSRLAQLPRREGYACPICKTSPPVGDLWNCVLCRQPFDTFQTRGACPHCPGRGPLTPCLNCGRLTHMSDWIVPAGENSLNLKKSRPTRIVIADSHPIFRDGLRRLLETEPDLEVVGEAYYSAHVVRLAQQLKPDILLLDQAMLKSILEGPGSKALRDLTSSENSTPVRLILLTAATMEGEIVEGIHLGARGVVPKDSATQVLLKVIHNVMGREQVSNLAQHSPKQVRYSSGESWQKKFRLTARELEIVPRVVAGYSNKEIAQSFKIGEATVKHFLANIFAKLGVSSRLELAKLLAMNNSAPGDSADPYAPVCAPLKPKPHLRSGGAMVAPEPDDTEQIFPEMKLSEGEQTKRARNQLEVNMRERERERLACRDAYDWDVQRRGKKRKQG
jgi:DNA-binding NarL/FixJ family response regulator/Zn-dependent protease